jgi:tRNA1Val (adenine37-N6)-methyltransferase
MRPYPETAAPVLPGAWRLHLTQDVGGYRFALDAFVLADFVAAPVTDPLLDLGTGCGVVALCLARRFPQLPIVGLELQTALVLLAQRNVGQNGLAHQVAIVQGDMRQVSQLLPAGHFGTVVCNPPYRPLGSGRLNPQSEKAIARHELTVTLGQVVQAARHVLRRRGVLGLVYHPSRLAELFIHLAQVDLRPRCLRLVHATRHSPASMVLVEAVQAGRDALTVRPPLCVYQAPGAYSAEMQAIFAGRGVTALASS